MAICGDKNIKHCKTLKQSKAIHIKCYPNWTKFFQKAQANIQKANSVVAKLKLLKYEETKGVFYNVVHDIIIMNHTSWTPDIY